MVTKFRIIFMVIMLGTVTGSMAQLTGGGTGGESSSPKREKGQRNRNENAWIAVHLGLSNPIGKFKENNLNLSFDKAVGAMPGIYVAFDATIYLNATINTPVKIGISQSLAGSMNGVNWESWVTGSASFSGEPFVFAEYKIGILGTYEISPDLYTDTFFRIGVNCGLDAGEGSWGDESYWHDESFASEENTSLFNVGTNLGTHIRFKKLFGTLALNMGKAKWDYHIQSSGQVVYYKVPISTVRLGIGMRIR